MIDLVTSAALVGGLQSWRFGGKPEIIKEERLLAKLRAQFRELRELRAPPAFDDERGDDLGIAALEFPTWFVCQRCRVLEKKRGAKVNGRYAHDCAKGAFFVPVRFVLACAHGHLHDFSWTTFVSAEHHKNGCATTTDLLLKEGATGNVDDVRVECRACGESRAMREAMLPTGYGTCSGPSPWLGIHESECGQPQKLIVRTASNGYFAQVTSALSIPADRSCAELVQRYEEKLDAVVKGKPLAKVFDLYEELVPEFAGFSEAEIVRAVRVHFGLEKPTKVELRPAEYQRLTTAPPHEHGARGEEREGFVAATLPRTADLPKQIAKVVVVPRLREVRAQTGFTRLEDVPRDVLAEYPEDMTQLAVKPAPLAKRVTWLPAVEIKGEGLFVELDEPEVRKWEARVHARDVTLAKAYEAFKKDKPAFPEYFGIRYYLLHSLSHLLMQAVSLTCGYASASIRERIYSTPLHGEPMAGILLSTGTPGSEGTLGGLAEQGTKLIEHLRCAWDLGRLCSNDPVCAKHDPLMDPTDRRVHGAACHGCLFVAEPSCEQYNRLLDRALVVPTMGLEDLAFFPERP